MTKPAKSYPWVQLDKTSGIFAHYLKFKILFMNKTFLSIAVLVSAAVSSQAQITLTAATHTPVVGSATYTTFIDTAAMPMQPAIGANITWNYASVIADGMDTPTYFSCVPQANCASFGNANLLSGSVADSSFQYYKTGSAAFQETGFADPGSELRLTNFHDALRFPFTYNSKYNDAYTGTATASGFPLPLTFSGVDTVSAPAYGVLITPVGQFTNVLMTRSNNKTNISALGQSFFDSRIVTYNWYQSSSPSPVMQIVYQYEVDSNGSEYLSGASGMYRTSNPAAVTNVAAPGSLTLFPNPASGLTTLQLPEGFGATATITVTDLTGKQVYELQTTGQAAISINTTTWAKGLYMVRVQHANGIQLLSRLTVL
ncbi:MAG: T9SS type A sorting domain-containing protein [Sphingobacteriales bacterium]|nr:MAG: T9SS type A sorting domain-containing protein [Sphingobacteriales bacterium]